VTDPNDWEAITFDAWERARQSNAGGRLWYGNVKATQELAKDAFDAINSQLAFSP
jgi:hypothetical protein